MSPISLKNEVIKYLDTIDEIKSCVIVFRHTDISLTDINQSDLSLASIVRHQWYPREEVSSAMMLHNIKIPLANEIAFNLNFIHEDYYENKEPSQIEPIKYKVSYCKEALV